MTKAPENAPALLFLGDNEKNGGSDVGCSKFHKNQGSFLSK